MAGRTTRAELLSPRPPDVRLHLADRYILATYWAMAARLLSLWPEIWTSKPIASLTCGTILVCDVTNFLLKSARQGTLICFTFFLHQSPKITRELSLCGHLR